MPTLIKKWNDIEQLSITYEGTGSGSIIIESDTNEGLDRQTSATIKDVSSKVSSSINIKQIGRREEFYGSDGEFSIANSGTFNVIK